MPEVSNLRREVSSAARHERETGDPGRERADILQSLDKAVNFLRNIPEASRTPKQSWIMGAIESAKNNIGDDGKFLVKAGGNEQREGIPVDALIEELGQIEQQQRQSLRDKQSQVANLRGQQVEVLTKWLKEGAHDITSEHQLKMAWHEVYNKENSALQTEVDNLRKSWAKVDGKGDDYQINTDEFALQSGEALRQIVEKHNQDVLLERDKAEQLHQSATFLHDHSKGYFELRPDMKGDRQHWRTEYEAKFISQDWRSTGSVEGDYNRAMNDMGKRRELLLPDLTHVPEPTPTPTPEPTPTPTPEPVISKRKKIRIVDVSELAEYYARKMAKEKLTEFYDTKGEKWYKTLYKSLFTTEGVKKVWVRLDEAGYLDRFYKEALEEIKNNKNLQAEIELRIFKRSEGKLPSGSKDNTYVLLDNVIDEYEKDVIAAEERGESINDLRVSAEVGQLIADYATGKITSREDFDKQVDTKVVPLIQKDKFVTDASRKKEAKGIMYSNNIFELAKNYKIELENKIKKYGESQRERVMLELRGEMDLSVNLGLKKADLYEKNPAEQFSWMEKFIDKMQHKMLGTLLGNPPVYGAVAGAAGMVVGRSVARMAMVGGTAAIVGPWGASLLAAAAFGGGILRGRRGRELVYDRSNELRNETLGLAAGGDKAKAVRQHGYGVKRAEDFTATLQSVLTRGSLTDSDKAMLAEIKARFKVEKDKSVNLIGVYGGEGQKYGTRAIGMKNLKVVLKEVEKRFNIKDDDLKLQIDNLVTQFNTEIDKQDKSFNKFKAKEKNKAAVCGVMIGTAAGVAAQEAVEGIRELVGAKPVETAVRHLWHYMHGDTGSSLSSKLQDVVIDLPNSALNSTMKIPEGTSLVWAGDHFDLISGKGEKLIDVFVNKDGTLASRTLTELQGKGWGIQDQIQEVAGSGKISPLDYFKDELGKHPRADWHDEPGQRFSNFFHKLIEFEGKQQMGYLNRNSDGSIFVDAGKMIQNLKDNLEGAFKEFGTNPDGSFDSKLTGIREQLAEALKNGTLNGKMGVNIIPTEEANKAGLGMIAGFADNSGHVNFSSKLSSLFTTEQSLHYLHHPVKYIEIFFQGSDGRHVLATTIGGDMQPVTGAPEIVHNISLIPGPQDHDWAPPPTLPEWFSKRTEAPKKGVVVPPRTPEETTPEHHFYGSSDRLKRHYTELNEYRNSEVGVQHLIDKLQSKPELASKYAHVFARLDNLKKYDSLPASEKSKIQEELIKYNKRYHDTPLTLNVYISQEIQRIYRQVENIVLEESNVGDKPFDLEFYANSPLLKGLENSNEVVVIFNDAMGDAIFTVPVVDAIDKYFKQNNNRNKKIKIVTAQPALFKNLEYQYNGLIEIVSTRDMKDYFTREGVKERFVLNAHSSFEDYEMFGFDDDDVNDRSKVMSVDWASWHKEEVPVIPGRINKYDPIPARIMRNFEVMTGQKLYKDINSMDHFLEKDKNHNRISAELKAKYNIKDSERLVVIAPGASTMTKEYTPAKWREVIVGICEKHPLAHVLFLDDPNAIKRESYGVAVDKLKSEKNYNISRVNDGLDKMNTIMSMADVAITPDTGLGHLASGLGKPNVMFYLSDPVRWSAAQTKRVAHSKAVESYKTGRGIYNEAWQSPTEYYVDDKGERVGASDIEPKRILDRVDEVLSRGTNS